MSRRYYCDPSRFSPCGSTPDEGSSFLYAQTNSSLRLDAAARVIDHITNVTLPALEA